MTTVIASVGRQPPSTVEWLSVYGVLVATLLGFVTGIGFFTVGGIYGPLSDLTGLLVAVFLVPVVRVLHRLHRDVDGRSGTVQSVGLFAAGLLGVGSLMLVLGNTLLPNLSSGAFLGLQFLGILLEGGWLVGIGMVSLGEGVLGRRQAWAGVAAGVGYVTSILGLSASLSFMHPVVLGGGLLSLVGVLGWGLLLGRECRTMAE